MGDDPQNVANFKQCMLETFQTDLNIWKAEVFPLLRYFIDEWNKWAAETKLLFGAFFTWGATAVTRWLARFFGTVASEIVGYFGEYLVAFVGAAAVEAAISELATNAITCGIEQFS